jgi:hypothetical protein
MMTRFVDAGRVRLGILLLIAVSLLGAIGVSAGFAAGRASAPTLGQPWAPAQNGYGEVRPRRVFNGGDPTGLVMHIHWKHWGAKRSWGWGTGIFVWPGTSVAEGIRARARIVAYHLGQCHGVRSYNAITWFFPRYRQKFHPRQHINDCTGRYMGSGYHPTHCRSVNIGRKARAYEITTQHLRCRQARRLIATSPAPRYAINGGRFIHRGFYCGTTGWYADEPPAIFSCGLDVHDVTFDLAYGD